MRQIILSAALLLIVACSKGGDGPVAGAGEGAVIYPAAGVVTMTAPDAVATAIAVKNGRILATGTAEELARSFPKASVDNIICP